MDNEIKLRERVGRYWDSYTLSAAYERNHRWCTDRMRQGLLNNLWGNNPGELERWADDGGYAGEQQ